MSLTRRRFLAYTAGTLAAGTLPACATVPRYPSHVSEGRLAIDLLEFNEIAGDGQALQIEADGLCDPILLVRDRAGELHAISSRCTHQACRVRPEGQLLSCPCHGSTFALDGEVMRGPARDPLPTFPVLAREGRIEILVRGGAAS